MQKIQCELCGSNDLIKEDSIFVCQFCGCKYSLEEARKLIIEGKVDVSGSTVKLDQNDEIKSKLILSRNYLENNDLIKAEDIVDEALKLDSDAKDAWLMKAFIQKNNEMIYEKSLNKAKDVNSKNYDVYTEEMLNNSIIEIPAQFNLSSMSRAHALIIDEMESVPIMPKEKKIIRTTRGTHFLRYGDNISGKVELNENSTLTLKAEWLNNRYVIIAKNKR